MDLIRRMTAIAAPTSAPSLPAPVVSGYDKDAADGFGALLAQAGGAASNDKASSPRDTKGADTRADSSKAASCRSWFAERAGE